MKIKTKLFTLSFIVVFLSLSFYVSTIVAKPTRNINENFNGRKLNKIWNIENHGGSYNLGDGTLTLSTSGPAIILYAEYRPITDSFTFSAKVRATTLAAFGLRIHAGPLPIFGSTSGAMLEFDVGVENKHFVAVWNKAGVGWYWTTFYGPSMTDTWFILEMEVFKEPFVINYNVYNEAGVLLGTYSATDISFNYNDINYICLEAWSGNLVYDIDWLKIESQK